MTIMGGMFARPVPSDFEVTFVALGRDQCSVHYRCRKSVITAWLEASGKDALIARRAAYVQAMREQGRWITRNDPLVARYRQGKTVAAQIRDDRRVSPSLARRAAHFLRSVRNGGWIVSQAQNGDWWVGSRRRSPADLVDFAVGKGFDRVAADLQADWEGE